MNPLATLKEKLMIKPKVEDRERVAVVIKGVKKPTKPKAPKIKATEIEEIGEIGEIGEKEEKAISIIEDTEEEPKKQQPIIVDETQKGFNREALLQKLAESKKIKVMTTPIIEVAEEKKTIEPIPLPLVKKAKKAKKVSINIPVIIESDEEEVKKEKEEPIEPREKEPIEPREKEKVEEEDEEIIIIPKELKELKEKKKRKTPKVKKGEVILGPETYVEIGDTDLTKRIPTPSPPVFLKVSSYYMNNREIFINFINSLFEPYRKELEENKEEREGVSDGTAGSLE